VPEEQLPMEEFKAKEDLSYQEYPIKFFENIRESYAKQEDQDVQGEVEPPYRGRSYLGKGRRVEGRVSKFLFRSIGISRMRFISRGVGL
jgi:hypothetical protein